MKRLRCGKVAGRGKTFRRGARYAEAGFSLVEGLIAAALLLVIAVSVLPLFMQALVSNTRGGRSSQLTALVNAELESLNQATLDNPAWQLTGSGTETLELGTRFWDTGHLHSEANPAQLGDEGWVDTRGAAAGPVVWSRDLTLRKYSYADVHTTIDVGAATLSTLGDPRLFDSPLQTDDDGDIYSAHITEFRVHIIEDREGVPLGLSQRMTVGHFRAF